MPVTLSPGQLTDIVTTLRTSGCVFAEEEAQLLASAASGPGELAEMVTQRAAGLPIEQVVGWAEFCGLRVAVEPGVFVPRRRSEFLVRRAAELGPRPAEGGLPVVLDLCCGSGAIGLAVAAALASGAELHGAELHGAELHAADIDPAAVRCARRNVGQRGRVYQGDLYEPLPPGLRGRVDILVVNAPYVPTAEIALMPAEARLHEPRVALDGGPDGVDIHRRAASGAPAWLAPGGCLLIETSERQAPLTASAVSAAGLAPEVVTDDDWSAAVVIGRPFRS
jgi:release factor glutamine methyltransferase